MKLSNNEALKDEAKNSKANTYFEAFYPILKHLSKEIFHTISFRPQISKY